MDKPVTERTEFFRPLDLGQPDAAFARLRSLAAQRGQAAGTSAAPVPVTLRAGGGRLLKHRRVQRDKGTPGQPGLDGHLPLRADLAMPQDRRNRIPARPERGKMRRAPARLLLGAAVITLPDLDAGQMWARTASSMSRPARRSAVTASPLYSVVQVTTALVAMVRHHICSACCSWYRRRSAPSFAYARDRSSACRFSPLFSCRPIRRDRPASWPGQQANCPLSTRDLSEFSRLAEGIRAAWPAGPRRPGQQRR
jgi:hypothetical protein